MVIIEHSNFLQSGIYRVSGG